MSEEIKQYTLDQFHISYFLLMECSEYYANGDFEEANRRFYTFRSIIEEDQINGYIAFLIQNGVEAYQNKTLRASENLLTGAISISETCSDDKFLLAKSYMERGYVKFQLEKPNEGLSDLEKVLIASEEYEENDFLLGAREFTYRMLGVFSAEKFNDFRKSLYYFREGFKLNDESEVFSEDEKVNNYLLHLTALRKVISYMDEKEYFNYAEEFVELYREVTNPLINIIEDVNLDNFLDRSELNIKANNEFIFGSIKCARLLLRKANQETDENERNRLIPIGRIILNDVDSIDGNFKFWVNVSKEFTNVDDAYAVDFLQNAEMQYDLSSNPELEFSKEDLEAYDLLTNVHGLQHTYNPFGIMPAQLDN